MDRTVVTRTRFALRRRRADGVTEHTITKELGTLRTALELAKRLELWRGDVTALIPPLSPEYVPRERWLPLEEVRALLAQLEGDRAAQVAFAVATSAEWSALERAEWDDLGETFVRVRGTKSRLRERVVPVVTPWQKELLAFVRNHAAGQKPKLFAPWAQTTALHTLHAAAKRAGIDPCGWHDLRRSCAQLLRRAGASFDTLAPVLGHSDSKVTQRVYARLDPEGLLQALRAELRCDTGVPDSAASDVSAASLGQAPRPVR